MTMMMFKSVLALLWLGMSATNAQTQILIDPWSVRTNNQPFDPKYVLAGDTIQFVWPEDETQTVWIYPSAVCYNETGRRFVGDVPGTTYTFTEEDGSPTGNTLLFTSDIDDNCSQGGMRLRVKVYSGTSTLPPAQAPAVAPAAPTTIEATDSPTVSSTAAATTDSPSSSPTAPPVTDAPTATPVAPTLAPNPTLPPVTPTLAPSTEAPVATDLPTSTPSTEVPTMVTTAPVTTLPTTPNSSKVVTLRGVQMEIFGIGQFGFNTQSSWESTTAAYNTEYVLEQFDGIVSNFQTTLTVTDSIIVTTPQGRSLRSLQQQQDSSSGDSVKITYTQQLIYDTVDVTVTANMLAQEPFNSVQKRENYVAFLNVNAENLALSRVVDATAVTIGTSSAPTVPPLSPTLPPTPTPNSGGGDSTAALGLPAIIGIACGGGALLILIVIYFLYCRGGGSGKKTKKDSKSSATPPMTVSVNRDDEVSTLHDPKQLNGHGGGDQSIATVDYDYSKAYGGGDTSVSSAGGTLGDRTNNFSQLDPTNAAATGAALGAFDDDGSFENHYRTPGSNVKEEILHVFAPPGKLGVVIDTPDNGAPLVHAVKENSIIYGRVRVGDKLVAVDDEDCRTMTAVKVSKLISRKSANPSRKLTIVRTTTID